MHGGGQPDDSGRRYIYTRADATSPGGGRFRGSTTPAGPSWAMSARTKDVQHDTTTTTFFLFLCVCCLYALLPRHATGFEAVRHPKRQLHLVCPLSRSVPPMWVIFGSKVDTKKTIFSLCLARRKRGREATNSVYSRTDISAKRPLPTYISFSVRSPPRNEQRRPRNTTSLPFTRTLRLR